ncbi:MAG: TatD DNase family protein [Thermoanaerobaculia bacterium]|jgi:TatD DNase family protein|nr:TatD DNase family protein [Thermoanaerobaculia bacterium]
MHDAHCHIDLYGSYQEVLASIANAKLRTIAVTNTPSVFNAMENLVVDNPWVYPAIGLHPELVPERAHELPLLLERLLRVRLVGEIGLDFATRGADRNGQARVLEQILSACARDRGHVLSLHSRNAAADVVRLVGPNFPGVPILHWFSGSLKVLEQALVFGFYFSVNPAMTRSDRGRAILAALPRERVLTESDGPFVDMQGVPARPADVKIVVSYLANQWKISADDAEVILDTNFDTVLPDLPG